jgi:hypothetical protein
LQQEFQNENQQLEQALKEVQNSIKNAKNKGVKGEVVIQCPSLEKLLEVIKI